VRDHGLCRARAQLLRDREDLGALPAGSSLGLTDAPRVTEPHRHVPLGHASVPLHADHDAEEAVELEEIATAPGATLRGGIRRQASRIAAFATLHDSNTKK
jgi:hypothetical protein